MSVTHIIHTLNPKHIILKSNTNYLYIIYDKYDNIYYRVLKRQGTRSPTRTSSCLELSTSPPIAILIPMMISYLINSFQILFQYFYNSLTNLFNSFSIPIKYSHSALTLYVTSKKILDIVDTWN